MTYFLGSSNIRSDKFAGDFQSKQKHLDEIINVGKIRKFPKLPTNRILHKNGCKVHQDALHV